MAGLVPRSPTTTAGTPPSLGGSMTPNQGAGFAACAPRPRPAGCCAEPVAADTAKTIAISRIIERALMALFPFSYALARYFAGIFSRTYVMCWPARTRNA